MRSALLLAIVAWSGVVLGQRERDNTIRECFGKVADVFFVLDSSSSIYVEDYRSVLEFVSQVVTRFDVSGPGTRVGALTFSDDVQIGFDLNNYRSKSEVLAAINERSLPYRTGITRTDLAIRRVRQDTVFRQDITKVMVVITDGGSRSPGETRREADLARDAGFHMVVVGMGQYQDEQEWRAIASDPDNDYVFNITNYNFLGGLRDSLPRRICLMPPIIIGGECRVRNNADLLFVAGARYQQALDLVQELTDKFRPRERVNAAYIMDQCQELVDTDFAGPNRYCNRGLASEENFASLVTRMRRTATNMRESRSAYQVAVLFVDDQTLRDDRLGVVQEVRNAEQFDGIDIILVDLGQRSQRNLLISMITNRENFITYNDQQGLPQNAQRILDRVCHHVSTDFGELIPS